MSRDLDQQLVAAGVSEAVVDDLEAVQVEEQHGVIAAVRSARTRDCRRQFLLEVQPVRQTGQKVVRRVVFELALHAALLGDVADRAGRVALAVHVDACRR